jgi:hypothetical protein
MSFVYPSDEAIQTMMWRETKTADNLVTVSLYKNVQKKVDGINTCNASRELSRIGGTNRIVL